MFSRLWSLLFSRRPKLRPIQPRRGSFLKPSVLLLEDRVLPTGTPLIFNAPATQPLVATLRVVQDTAGPQIELVDNVSQHVLVQQALAATSQITIVGSPLNDVLTVDQSTPINLPIAFGGGGAADSTGDKLLEIGGGTT